MSRLAPITIDMSRSCRGDLDSLVKWFYSSIDELGKFTPVASEQLPAEYATLLAHENHMTVTVEAYYESLVDVRVLEERQDGHIYARQSLLTRRSDGGVVQYGIMRIDLGRLSPIAREQVEARRAPLGRILIRNNVLREVELRGLWRIQPGSVLTAQLTSGNTGPIYGRSAGILLDRQPAVELLEVVSV